MQRPSGKTETAETARWQALAALEDLLETPMLVLGFVWLGLLVLELLGVQSPLIETFGLAIWAVFILDFALKLSLAPRKGRFLRRNLLTAVSLLLPALRVFRVARAVRLLRLAPTARGLRLVRVVTSLNRGMRSLGGTMRRRGFGYVVALTLLVALAGAAGMVAFENGEGELESYGSALWWTVMLLTTLGSEYWPRSAEGRVLCLLLAVYGFAVFGYITATLASFFIGRDAASEAGELAGSAEVAALREELRALRAELRGTPREEG